MVNSIIAMILLISKMSHEILEQNIIKWLDKYDRKYIKITNTESLKIIHDFLINDKLDDITDYHDSYIYLYYGIYFSCKKDYKNMKKYFNIAIEKGNSRAMYWLGEYYQKKKK